MVSSNADCSKRDLTNKPLLYMAFHLNLAFSSIEEEDRKIVIERCYWPLLRLAEGGIPIGLEVTSYTLLEIQKVAPEWLEALKALIEAGRVELIGSGFCQIIGPLVPAELTRQNLRLGLEDYEALLGCRPSVALINEQAYSSGILSLYEELGFSAIMMDWAEPASHNRKWKKVFAHRPQRVIGCEGAALPVIWSDAISFQKFQRYAHGELTAEEYFEFLSDQIGNGAQAIPIYTSDAEVFDFRPGRFGSEAQLDTLSEFERIRLLLKSFHNSEEVVLALPRDALARLDPTMAPLHLETSAVPVPVKKQRKYNLTRWGLTGRADIKLNTHCWRLYEMFVDGSRAVSADDWRQLCLLWASDYRTHITGKRWQRLAELLPATKETKQQAISDITAELPSHISVQHVGRFLALEGEGAHLVLNMHRGLAIQSFGYGSPGMALSGKLGQGGAIGTLEHGFFDDIAYGADFYSGHFVIESALSHKVTDLTRCEPEVAYDASTGKVQIVARLSAAGSVMEKTIGVDLKGRAVDISYHCAELMSQAASKRLGFVTLNPDFFDRESLFYATHNGGDTLERYSLFPDGELAVVDQGAPVSRLVSASSALGMTDGRLYLGDADHYVCIEMKRRDCAGLGMVTCAPAGESFFLRGYISVGELDETSKFDDSGLDDKIAPLALRLRVALGETSKLLE